MRPFKNIFKRNRSLKENEIAPDEIFLDSSNLPNFDVDQFEGRFEKPITKKTVLILGWFFVLVGIVFISKVWILQGVNGASFEQKSRNNSLRNTPLFADRGVVYDRNKVELVWNSPRKGVFSKRSYIKKPGMYNVLGYVGYPKKDSQGFYYQKKFIGKAGVEKYYNDTLSGVNGVKIIETNAFMKIQSESVVKQPQNGKNITLSIDSRIQNKLYGYIKSTAAERGFYGGAGTIMSIENGEVLALVSFPEYDSNVLSDGKNVRAIRGFLNDNRKPFLDRPVSGLYTPGSIVKPFVAIGALNEGVITPEKKILSTGSISIQNPYYPKLKSVFKDWRANGWVNVKDALAWSSDVYFYEVGGGFKNQKGLGIERIKEYALKFGLSNITNIDIPGEVKGVIPDPAWKSENFNGEKWRIGDTYHTAIGQYGFQITPIQIVRGIAGIASDGNLVTPHLALSKQIKIKKVEGISKKYFEVVKEGMRQAVTSGSAQGLDVPEVEIAAKTGTAELGVSKNRVNSWIVGFFPYKNPKYAFAVVMEKGPKNNEVGGLYVMRQLFDWMAVNTPDYLKQ